MEASESREQNNSAAVSVIIPAYNEEKAIARVISEIPKGCEVIVVDDCSEDATAWVARDSGAKVLRNRRNMGPEPSRERALAVAKGEVIVTLDADGEHDPGEIPRLVSKLARGYDMVLGERPRLPRISERMMAWLVRRRVKGVRDATTGFRAIRKRRLRHIDMKKSLYGTNMILQMRKRGMNIASVPITTRRRRQHSRIRPLKIMAALLVLVKNVAFF